MPFRQQNVWIFCSSGAPFFLHTSFFSFWAFWWECGQKENPKGGQFSGTCAWAIFSSGKCYILVHIENCRPGENLLISSSSIWHLQSIGPFQGRSLFLAFVVSFQKKRKIKCNYVKIRLVSYSTRFPTLCNGYFMAWASRVDRYCLFSPAFCLSQILLWKSPWKYFKIVKEIFFTLYDCVLF